MYNETDTNSAVTQLFNENHRNYKCCGVNDASDWSGHEDYHLKTSDGKGDGIFRAPKTCCDNLSSNDECWSNSSQFHYTGCKIAVSTENEFMGGIYLLGLGMMLVLFLLVRLTQLPSSYWDY